MVEESKVDPQTEQEENIIKSAIQTLLDQYVNLFTKAKIFEIKKTFKLIKQIANYVTGFIMKKETAPLSSSDRQQAVVLQAHHTLISANVLRIIAKLGLIKMVDQNLIEHDSQKVAELAHSEQLRLIKPADFLFDVEEAR